MTPIIFRKFNEGGDVLALFPTLDAGNGHCTSYQHIGQHSGADYDGCLEITEQATVIEYASLLQELKFIGYDDLRIFEYNIQELCRDYRMVKDSGDNWGSMLQAHFEVCAVLCERGDDIPDAWEYQPGALGPEEPDEFYSDIFAPFPSGVLVEFGDLLSRGATLLKSRGESY